jgi:hypothetical protein
MQKLSCPQPADAHDPLSSEVEDDQEISLWEPGRFLAPREMLSRHRALLTKAARRAPSLIVPATVAELRRDMSHSGRGPSGEILVVAADLRGAVVRLPGVDLCDVYIEAQELARQRGLVFFDPLLLEVCYPATVGATASLLAALAALTAQGDGYLICESAAEPDYYAQVFFADDGAVWAEVVGDAHLPGARRLTRAQKTRLRLGGWFAPDQERGNHARRASIATHAQRTELALILQSALVEVFALPSEGGLALVLEAPPADAETETP